MTKQSPRESIFAVILAAGKGTRMKSDRPKVLHEIAGRPMLHYVLDTVENLGVDRQIIVVAPSMAKEPSPFTRGKKSAQIAIQKQQLGTGDAVKSGMAALKNPTGTVLILYGDTPFISEMRLRQLIAASHQHPVTVLGFQPKNPAEYGRLVLDQEGHVAAIVEYKDATTAERAIPLCNSGVMALQAPVATALLARIKNNNSKKEYYLTDIVALARGANLECGLVIAEEHEVLGVNSKAELAAAEQIVQQKLRAAAMENGATLIAPETVYLSHDTVLAPEVVVHPFVVFGAGVKVGARTEIRSFSHIAAATIGADAIIGPFARLRPGTVLADEVHIGNFVEVKKSKLARGAKANHLTYLGDAFVGENANIGAGTITCNYDGYTKSETRIGKGAFIGSNSSLIAPVTIGDGAIIGAGSTIRKNVPADALAINDMPQATKPGHAKNFRKKRQKK